jgi:hypothetical protein
MMAYRAENGELFVDSFIESTFFGATSKRKESKRVIALQQIDGRTLRLLDETRYEQTIQFRGINNLQVLEGRRGNEVIITNSRYVDGTAMLPFERCSAPAAPIADGPSLNPKASEKRQSVKVATGNDNKKAQAPIKALPSVEALMKQNGIGFNCEKGGSHYTGNFPEQRIDTFIGPAASQLDIKLFLDDDLLIAWLNNIREIGKETCRQRVGGIPPDFMVIGISIAVGVNSLFAYTNFPAPGWTIAKNEFRAAYHSQKQREAEEQRAFQDRQRILRAKAEFRANVHKGLGITGLSNMNDVRSNPFLYKGNILGLRANFVRMTSESEAVFTSASDDLIVTGVPTTLFRGNESVILALRIQGVRNGLPYGDYVGAHKCAQNNCQDFFD